MEDAWIYAPLPAGLRELEALHPWVAAAIIERFAPPGGTVLDPMAGSGVIGETASRLRRYAYLADLKPQHPHIRAWDVLRIDELFVENKVDLAVLHPPSFEHWRAGHRDFVELDYLNFLSDALAALNDCVTPGGHLIAITRPDRSAGRVIDTITPLLQGFKEACTLSDYLIAQASDGREHWHILVSKKES